MWRDEVLSCPESGVQAACTITTPVSVHLSNGKVILCRLSAANGLYRQYLDENILIRYSNFLKKATSPLMILFPPSPTKL
jgi:hypothetical protein